MRSSYILVLLILLVAACQNQPKEWEGPTLTHPRQQLTVKELNDSMAFELVDQSFLAKPAWSTAPLHPFTGTLEIKEAALNFPKQKEHYAGEEIFPYLQLDFVTHKGIIIPQTSKRISTIDQEASYWDVIVGAGAAWQEPEDGAWSRASFPLTLTDRWIGTARNCVATFVYQPDTISNICLQCSQETADIDDKGLGNIRGTLAAKFQQKQVSTAPQIINEHLEKEAARLPIRPLSDLDKHGEIATYFERNIVTNAPTSLGAVYVDGHIYLHPPKTRHGSYPYPNEMRHGLYSVTKSMAGALALLFLEERYEDNLFDLKITDYVPALAQHPGWQGVTFSHTLNMVTGTDGGEDAARLLNTLIVAETAEEAIANIATLADAPAVPGQQFNYASTNLFVLSYALQQYVTAKESKGVNYWNLVQEQLLSPIGAKDFTVLHTIEKDSTSALPILAYGALPTIDEAAKIALLFANGGTHQGKQILSADKTKALFSNTSWENNSTNNDFRGSGYQHGFWSKIIDGQGCQVRATYMLGFGENYVVFLPSGSIIFRFLDEHDLNIDELILAVERVYPSCG